MYWQSWLCLLSLSGSNAIGYGVNEICTEGCEQAGKDHLVKSGLEIDLLPMLEYRTISALCVTGGTTRSELRGSV